MACAYAKTIVCGWRVEGDGGDVMDNAVKSADEVSGAHADDADADDADDADARDACDACCHGV